MRQRSTWSSPTTPRQAATNRQADIYTMNQEHPQPTPVQYENGNPDTWAETQVPADQMSVKGEYDGDHVKRNSLNFGEFREDTWKHKDSDQWNGKGKYDNAKVAAERKAAAAERVARAILRTSNEKLVEDTAVELMAVPAKVLAATIKRLDQVSPDALTKEAKLRRALACCKLAARTLRVEDEKLVERLGSVFMTLDDPTLRAVLQVVAAARIAEQQEEQGQEQEEEQEEGKQAQGQQEQQGQQEEQEEQEEEQQEQQGQDSCLTAEELACLDGMLQNKVPEAPVPVVAPPAAVVETDDLNALFGLPAPATTVTPVASMNPDISFDDDDADVTLASDGLDSIFGDHPEVVAQREIAAAELDQKTREGGFGSVGRTASSKGAKKLGVVRPTKTVDVDDALSSIWERPGQ